MAALSVKTSITKFENTENSCAKMKLYFKKTFKRIKILLNSMETCPKAKFGSSSHTSSPNSFKVMVSSGNICNSDCDLNIHVWNELSNFIIPPPKRVLCHYNYHVIS